MTWLAVMRRRFGRLGGLGAAVLVLQAGAAIAFVEPPMLAKSVRNGTLPPVNERLPQQPLSVAAEGPDQSPGRYGGELRMLMSQPKDTRMMVVFGYSRLVGYDPSWHLVPDILESVDVEAESVFTLHLRKGHRWSDGHPFTAEDFRFYWDDIANNAKLSPGGLDRFLLADGKPPRFTVIDETTVRYSWDAPNPFFLPALAGARPDYVYAPAHYLKQFHPRYTDAATLDRKVAEFGQRNWTALFTLKGQMYRNDNVDLPTLEPWRLVTPPPSTRFVFERNPYFHRVDVAGQQLPYIDRVAFSIVSPQLIPAKTAAGEADLQARNLSFENYTVLKQGSKRNGFQVRLWRSARGSEMALYPDLTASDPVWRQLLQDVRFRRALSLAIDRHEINEVEYYGLAQEGNDTILPESPLYRSDYALLWAKYDPEQANRLLDQIGLTKRDARGIRLLPDGRPMEIVVETAGEDPIQLDILQLIADTWREVGIHLYAKPEQREVLRNRTFAGSTVMSVWYGLDNALPSANSPPIELAPTTQQQLNWPKWGQYYETRGRSGEPPDLPEVVELALLNDRWISSTNSGEKAEIWQKMLSIRADQVLTIGSVRGVPQPVVVNNRLHNVPLNGLYNWDPGAYFGVYRPDSFWFEEEQTISGN